MQKNNLTKYLIIIVAISAVLAITRNFLSLNGAIIISILNGITFLLALICLKKLRATFDTDKLYNIMLIITGVIVAVTIFSGIYSNHVMNSLKDLALSNMKNQMKIIDFISHLNNILILLQMVIMVYIIFKEKTDINWMLLGKLTTLNYYMLNSILRNLQIKSSLFQIMSGSVVISIFNSLLWIIGAAFMVLQIKKSEQADIAA
jgi:hypothetical protein